MQAKTTLVDSIPIMMSWMGKFKRTSPTEDSVVSVGWRDGRDVEEGFCVKGITDIEESIWAPKYGLKGKIDSSLEAVFVDYSARQVTLRNATRINLNDLLTVLLLALLRSGM